MNQKINFQYFRYFTMKLSIVSFSILLFCFSCTKTEKNNIVTGTIGGTAATTLYGNSGKSADYLFLSNNPTINEISYNENIYYYFYLSNQKNTLFLTSRGIAVAKVELDTINTKIIFKIDTAYGMSFGSTLYTSN